MMAAPPITPSDHGPAELAPGSPSPLAQPPEGGGAGGQALTAEPLLTASSNTGSPEQAPYSVEPIPGTNKTVTNPYNNAIDSLPPERVTFARPPIGKGFGVDGGRISLPGSTQLPEGVGQSQNAALGQFNQGNLVPLVAFPVLSRLGPQGVSWAAAVPLAGFTSVTLRGAYRDLKITPGFRGIQLQYGSVSVKVTENTTGMVYYFPVGPHTVFAPLFMLREFYDITIAGSAAFPAGASALLTTEEQLPYMF